MQGNRLLGIHTSLASLKKIQSSRAKGEMVKPIGNGPLKPGDSSKYKRDGHHPLDPNNKPNHVCDQMAVMVVDADVFVTDLVHYFFARKINPKQVSEELSQIVSEALWEATNMANCKGYIPAPTMGKADAIWLTSEAVQMGFRKAHNKCKWVDIVPQINSKYAQKVSQAILNGPSKPIELDQDQQPSEAKSWHGGSDAFYDTGEHVLAGEGDHMRLHRSVVYSVNGVSFAYADLIAIADFYDTDAQLKSAAASELSRLKKYILNSRAFYEKKVLGKGSGATNPGTPEWMSATGGRYITLAEDNFGHFAPTDKSLIGEFSGNKKNHFSEYSIYHSKAIGEIRKGVDSTAFNTALVTNAFADHFLTDAFSAGHLFNKNDLTKYFTSKVISGGKVNSAGEGMFGAIASAAWHGKVKERFSKMETKETVKGVHWNINTANMLKKLLIAIMEKEPDIIGKSVVAKIIHDALNNYPGGLPVENGLGDNWNLTGDGTLNTANLARLQKAVKQSVENVEDAVNSKDSASSFVAKTWKHVPKPTAAGKKILSSLIAEYTNPSSSKMHKGIAGIIYDNHEALLDELEKRGQLKKRDGGFWDWDIF